MYQTIFKSTLLTLLLTTAILGVSAQVEPQTVRRNSPFSPNPKRKVQISDQDSKNNKPVEIAKNSESKVKQNGESAFIKLPNENSTNDLTDNSAAKKSPEKEKSLIETNLVPTDVYKIGIGDILFIALQNAPSKETNYFTVLQDGKIDYPLAGEMVSVLNLTTEQVEKVLKEKIQLYENPQVTVKVREYNSHSYTVIGMVEKSGEKFLQREAIPLFVVRAEAFVQPRANRAIISRKNAEKQIIDLKNEKSGETLIVSGDIIEFSVDDSQQNIAKSPLFYYIGGEIVSGGQKDFHQGIRLTQAILAAGGLKNSKAKKVVIRRKSVSGLLSSIITDLKAVKNGKAIDLVLEPGDTIEIGN